MASGVQGILAASTTSLTPFVTSDCASASVSSFWVAQGKAASQAKRHTAWPSVGYWLLGINWAWLCSCK